MSGDTGFLHPVKDAGSFAEQVIRLYNSDTELKELSAREVDYMQKNFSHTTALSIFSELLSS